MEIAPPKSFALSLGVYDCVTPKGFLQSTFGLRTLSTYNTESGDRTLVKRELEQNTTLGVSHADSDMETAEGVKQRRRSTFSYSAFIHLYSDHCQLC